MRGSGNGRREDFGIIFALDLEGHLTERGL